MDVQCISGAYVDYRFNSDHPNISRVFANANLDLGINHWGFRYWNPNFGDISRYKLCKWIGDGRYSDVFVALQDDSKECVVKILKPVNTDRVRRELKILTIIQGPNILKLLDIVIDKRESIPAMVTELCPNVPYRKLFSSMTLLDAKFYIYRVLQALNHAHSLGIMHRDIKPLNILCENPREKVVVADWGLAEFYHPLRRYSSHVATKYYKSPEILLEYCYYDYSLDIWSLGVVLLEILSNRIHVFDSDDPERLIDAIAAVTGGAKIVECSMKYGNEISEEVSERLKKIEGIPLENMIPYSRASFRDKDALDLLYKMLNVDHKERISAAEALEHPFFKEIREHDLKDK
ncbi:CMGC family protein kinase [Histomonas meleagridis]|uniref:CMGC family protein kinase n=1 Tax=Histomonas meleagridis TaxID=135588 RepID=UPI003559B2EA|nr:CMGC family protein kinase [Histomonas meleagridis]KAH0796235.1 CMGC family protein kinase [Histomonas meleagridis]